MHTFNERSTKVFVSIIKSRAALPQPPNTKRFSSHRRYQDSHLFNLNVHVFRPHFERRRGKNKKGPTVTKGL